MYLYIYIICVIYIFNIQALSIVQTMSSVVANIPRQFFNILSRVYIYMYIRVDILFLLIRLIVINKLSVTLHVKYVFVYYWAGGVAQSRGLGRGDVQWPVCLR